MRDRILEIVPAAEEIVSYGMPAFRVDDVIVAGLLANKKHVGYYPFSGSILHLFPDELAKYSTTKSAIHIPIDKPLAKGLIKKLIKARINQ
ncbi:DU1801 domain-containing protein [Candidatus Planktophila sulfonica]|uniref:DU1801 domain-containing protein n=2 Tax=Candidatus Planktophila sulfonica TaxID=1884904 RepID=A0A249KIU9_9ACTN|nr:DU1801 domain-containing protein [Candidatus Planktophila sulfonica]